MSIASERVGDVVVLTPVDRLDTSTGPALGDAVAQFLENRAPKLLIDLTEVSYVSSVGLSTCLKSAQLAEASGTTLALSGLTGPVREVFEFAGLEKVLTLQPSRDAALLAFEHAEPSPATRAAESVMAFTLPEEILLLALRDEGGHFVDLPVNALDYALAGAVLMELCSRRRIDIDLRRLIVVDPTPVDDDVLDPALTTIARSGEERDAEHWVGVLAHEGPEIKRRVIDHLVRRRILERKDNLVFWMLGGRRYPLKDGEETGRVRSRVLSVLRTTEVPGPEDVVLIALADACAVFDAVLDMDEMIELRDRIRPVAGMDLLAQAMTRALRARQTETTRGVEPKGVYG